LRGPADPDEMRHWLQVAANQEYPAAVIELNAIQGFAPDIDKKKLFERAFEDTGPRMVSLMTLYHSVSDNPDDTEFTAWSYFICEQDVTCSSKDFLDAVLNGRIDHQAEAIVARIAEIGDAFDQREWDQLVPVH
jgi:hypothetical protein